MTVASTVPAAVDALEDNYTKWLVEAGYETVGTFQADPPEPPAEYVQIGAAAGAQEWATQAPFRDERYSITCWLFVKASIETTAPRDLKARAFALHGVLAAGVRELPGLGIEDQYRLFEAQHGAFVAHPAPQEWGSGYWIRFEIDIEAIF